ncbi:MAG: hypothetical protein WEF86_06815 [Gemmatimonadota bacterium]
MKSSTRMLLLAVALAGAAACSGGDAADEAAPADTLTRAQRDSIIGASSLPGAGAVRDALDIADSAAARQRGVDSLMRAP